MAGQKGMKAILVAMLMGWAVAHSVGKRDCFSTDCPVPGEPSCACGDDPDTSFVFLDGWNGPHCNSGTEITGCVGVNSGIKSDVTSFRVPAKGYCRESGTAKIKHFTVQAVNSAGKIIESGVVDPNVGSACFNIPAGTGNFEIQTTNFVHE